MRRGPCNQDRPGVPVEILGYSAREMTILTVARHYFSSFAVPVQHGWMSAISTALQAFDTERGPQVAVATLCAVQTMRRARCSTFRFNTPECPRCARHVSQHERVLMAAIRAAARAQDDDATAHALILCEGNDVAAFARALATLAEVAFAEERDVPERPKDRASPSGVGA